MFCSTIGRQRETRLTTERKKRSKQRAPWRKLAELRGVSTKTLDRWVAKGIYDPPERINGRKYGDPHAEPRLDVA
jgi:hypothetical protein